MKRLLTMAVIAAIAWYGWKHYAGLRSGPSNVAVLDNQSGRQIERVRLTVDQQTLVKETVADGAKSEVPFRIQHDSDFHLVWQSEGKMGEAEWTGGTITAGPMVSRNRFVFLPDGSVIWTTEAIPGESK